MKQSRKEFVLKAHASACREWKTNIEKEYPKLFKKNKLKIGKWYKGSGGYSNYIIFITGIKNMGGYNQLRYYGFAKTWKNDYIANTQIEESLTPATRKEIETALTEEAKIRGFKSGVKIDKTDLNYSGGRKVWTLNGEDEFSFHVTHNELTYKGSTDLVFAKGSWATIVPQEKTYEYSIEGSSGIWTSFDHGEVKADTLEEATKLAKEKLTYDFEKANESLAFCDNTINFKIEMDLDNIEVKLKP